MRDFTFRGCIIVLFSILLSHGLFAQDQDENAQYFDDAGISNAKNVVKIGLVSLYYGELPIFYERLFGKAVALEVGVGMLLPYYNQDIMTSLLSNYGVGEDQGTLDDPGSGYSIWVCPKFYLRMTAPEGYYTGFLVRKKFRENAGLPANFTDIALLAGYNYMFGKRFLIDYSLGFGYRTVSGEGAKELRDDYIMPISIKFAVLF